MDEENLSCLNENKVMCPRCHCIYLVPSVKVWVEVWIVAHDATDIGTTSRPRGEGRCERIGSVWGPYHATAPGARFLCCICSSSITPATALEKKHPLIGGLIAANIKCGRAARETLQLYVCIIGFMC